MVFDRPKPNRSQPKSNNPAPATTPATNKTTKRVLAPVGGNGGGNRADSGGSGGGNNGEPSPWLLAQPSPDATASFVEYLRWMRSPDIEKAYKDPTKVQILQLAAEGANYQDRLKVLNQRTKAIAGDKNWFSAKSLWRMRVGGHKGPENILLPAFDALGIPYLPASTLRGVARTQAIRHFMAAEDLAWKAAEDRVSPYFGALDADAADRSGKVIFLDAYPNGDNSTCGLMVDMANNIWSWKNNQPEYNPNPNPFLSLHQAEFIIGIRPTAQCTPAVLQQVHQWLVEGLQQGAGSQINTGYGTLLTQGQSKPKGFLEVDFRVEGQLIHGQQRFDNVKEPYQRERNGEFKRDRNGDLKSSARGVAETRPVAFKSMLRYWFRTIALGVLPADRVKTWEAQIFGAIDPQTRGWLRVELLDGKVTDKEARYKDDPCGAQKGKLVLQFSPEAPLTAQPAIERLVKNLTWLMFHLGGIGQGARRPCYSRASRQYAPWWRGSDLIAASKGEFWQLPESIDDLQKLFQTRLKDFHQALVVLTSTQTVARSAGVVSIDTWVEALDTNAVMLICTGLDKYDKPYALSVLHDDGLKVQNRGKLDYDPNLCGSTTSKPVKPSPVWIANFGDFQVVSIFGVDDNPDNPRSKFLKNLQQTKNGSSYRQIHPID
jgi:CRISPR-associated protein Cmr6